MHTLKNSLLDSSALLFITIVAVLVGCRDENHPKDDSLPARFELRVDYRSFDILRVYEIYIARHDDLWRIYAVEGYGNPVVFTGELPEHEVKAIYHHVLNSDVKSDPPELSFNYGDIGSDSNKCGIYFIEEESVYAYHTMTPGSDLWPNISYEGRIGDGTAKAIIANVFECDDENGSSAVEEIVRTMLRMAEEYALERIAPVTAGDEFLDNNAFYREVKPETGRIEIAQKKDRFLGPDREIEETESRACSSVLDYQVGIDACYINETYGQIFFDDGIIRGEKRRIPVISDFIWGGFKHMWLTKNSRYLLIGRDVGANPRISRTLLTRCDLVSNQCRDVIELTSFWDVSTVDIKQNGDVTIEMNGEIFTWME